MGDEVVADERRSLEVGNLALNNWSDQRQAHVVEGDAAEKQSANCECRL